MAKTDWITDEELGEYLAGIGVATVPAGIELEDEIAAAIEEFERIAGFSPFLQDENSGEYAYDPSRRDFMDLKCYFMTVESVSIDGAEQEEGLDYWLRPNSGAPYTNITTRGAWRGDPQSIVVTGKKGYSATIPVRLWNAVRDFAAAGVYQAATVAGTASLGPKTEIKQDDVTIKFAGGSSAMGQDSASRMRAGAVAVFESYRKLTIGGIR